MIRKPMNPGDGDPRHGTSNGYSNQDCRCPQCTKAWAAYIAARRARVRGQEPPTHDNGGYVNWGCRCRTCTAAHAQARREWLDRNRRHAAWVQMVQLGQELQG